jgi:hypothetical protein
LRTKRTKSALGLKTTFSVVISWAFRPPSLLGKAARPLRLYYFVRIALVGMVGEAQGNIGEEEEEEEESEPRKL